MNASDPSFNGVDPIAERNVERLLTSAYRPEAPSAAFVAEVRAAMRAAAQGRATPSPRPQAGGLRSLAWAVAASLLLVLGAIVGLALLGEHAPPQPGETAQAAARGQAKSRSAETAPPAPALLGGMTARPAPPAPPAEVLQVGRSIETGSHERRRLAMADGSVLYLNRNTAVALDGPRRLSLRRGEIYVEVAASAAAGGPEPFTVNTPAHGLVALGTRFEVRVDPDETSLLVTQGKVQVDGMAVPVSAGQQVTLGPAATEEPATVSPAPRTTHAIDWTRELLEAARSPLVPAGKYSGGALVAADPSGAAAEISLRKYHVDVFIEDGFARTTIDQTYFNQTPWRMEGTFYFPLPPDASLSRLAMYVDGRLMEGGMAERGHARAVYESIVSRQKDPALLEWVDGSTFKMRVFPLEGRQEKRIVLSYTQRVASLYGQSEYRFPGGHNLPRIGQWSAHLRVRGGAGLDWSAEPQFHAQSEQGDLVLDALARDVRPDRDIVLSLRDGEQGGPAAASFRSALSEGSKYLMLRWRPDLPGEARRQRRDWIFLFESSGDRDPLLARAQIEVVRTILENAEHDDTFSILAAGAGVRAYRPEAQAATPENVAAAVRFLEGVHLVGALDLGQALAAARPLAEAADNPVLVHVGSGVAVLGERGVDALVDAIPRRAAYVGVGVGHRWARTFMKAAARRTGGWATQITLDQPIAWRALDLLATLNTPRLVGVRVADVAGRLSFLPCEDSLAQGEELVAVARLDADAPMPEPLEVAGLVGGKPRKWTIGVAGVAAGADYLPRTWAKLRIDRLVAEGAEKHRAEIVALSKAMYVLSPFTSLLVLENEEMYAQYGVDRGRKDHWAMYACPPRIPVVYEPLAPQPPETPAPLAEKPAAKKPTVEQVLATVLVRRPTPVLLWPESNVMPKSKAEADFDDLIELITTTVAPKTWDTDGGQGTIDKFPTNLSLVLSQTQEVRESAVEQAAQIEVQRTINRARGIMRNDPQKVLQDLRTEQQKLVLQTADLRPEVAAQLTGTLQAAIRAARAQVAVVQERERRQQEVVAAGQERMLINESLTREQTKVRQLMDRFDSIMREGKYSEAEEDAVREVQEIVNSGMDRLNNPQAVGATLDARVKGALDSAMALRIARQRGFVDTLYQVERSHVPFPVSDLVIPLQDEPPIVYPSADEWKKINKRKEKWGSAELAHRGAAEKKIERALKEPTTIEFDETPLQAVIDYLKDLHHIEIQFDMKELQTAGVDPDATLVTKNLKGISLRSALKLLLDDLQLKAVIHNEVLLITTPEGVEHFFPPAWSVAALRWPGDSDDRWRPLLYRPPEFNRDPAVFYDLLGYAPGMRTSLADVAAVLEAEADAPAAQPGKIDERARRLIQRARAAGWQRAVLRDRPGMKGFAVEWDGAGRCRYERTTRDGLREQVLCDGTTLWHLYPELGLGARRSVSRFHREALAQLIPWALPPAEDLARGADLLAVDEKTVAIVPHATAQEGADVSAASSGQNAHGQEARAREVCRLLFADDGRLAERQWVEEPSGKVLRRESCAAGAEITPAPSAEPRLRPDAGLVILPLPLRTPAHLEEARDGPRGDAFANWSEEDALAMVAADLGTDAARMKQIIRRRFFERGDRRLGFYALLFSANQIHLQPDKQDPKAAARPEFDPLADHPREPLARYIAAYLAATADGADREFRAFGPAAAGAKASDRSPQAVCDDGFLRQLAEFHDVRMSGWSEDYHAHGASDASSDGKKEMDALFADARRDNLHLLDCMGRMNSPELAWLVWNQAQDRVYWRYDSDARRRIVSDLADAAARFQATPRLHYYAQYAIARQWANAGDGKQAQAVFERLYTETLDAGGLPPIDASFREAFQESGDGPRWRTLMLAAARKLLAGPDPLAALRLARQVDEAGDAALVEELYDVAQRTAPADDRLCVTLARIDHYRRHQQLAKADALLQTLLGTRDYADSADLWRLAEAIATARGMTAAAIGCRQRALDIQYEDLRDLADAEPLCREYRDLLAGYEKLLTATAPFGPAASAELLGRIVRAADQWRQIDADPAEACQAAGRVLAALGATDLAWEYFTTPLALRPDESGPWLELAGALAQQGQIDRADRVYAAAFQIEPGNAQILWERASALWDAGRQEQARPLFRQIVAGPWAPRFADLQARAKQFAQ
jgi:ferric-dicitrate binding protein FerR (iron transport regulator)